MYEDGLTLINYYDFFKHLEYSRHSIIVGVIPLLSIPNPVSFTFNITFVYGTYIHLFITIFLPQMMGKRYMYLVFWQRTFIKKTFGTSLEVQWLRVHASNAEGMGSIPGWAAKIPTCRVVQQKVFLKKEKDL